MKITPSLLILAGALTLVGCKRQSVSQTDGRHGRYVGIGLYSAGAAWQRITDTALPKVAGKAGLADDEQVIVVVDSDTGEIRQCGALSGYCVGMKPWDHAVSQTLPVNLSPPPAAK
jgi:hypothetical protein